MAQNVAARSESERIAVLEEALRHLATKEDLGKLRNDFADLRAELRTIKWIVGLGIPATAATVGLIVQLLGQNPA
ncbi:MAG: hypothetical protein OXG85_09000 [Chloroflexi bacterium]|nr:hypothetical protein [Chloroflexota bacterium]